MTGNAMNTRRDLSSRSKSAQANFAAVSKGTQIRQKAEAGYKESPKIKKEKVDVSDEGEESDKAMEMDMSGGRSPIFVIVGDGADPDKMGDMIDAMSRAGNRATLKRESVKKRSNSSRALA